MTDEEIHNIYLHMSGKAEGLVEATGKADFPVMFARAILEYEGMTKDVQNMASKSTYKEQLETKDETVKQLQKSLALAVWDRQEVEALLFKLTGVKWIPKSNTPQRTWVGLTKEDLKLLSAEWRIVYGAWMDDFAREIEAKLKERNT